MRVEVFQKILRLPLIDPNRNSFSDTQLSINNLSGASFENALVSRADLKAEFQWKYNA